MKPWIVILLFVSTFLLYGSVLKILLASRFRLWQRVSQVLLVAKEPKSPIFRSLSATIRRQVWAFFYQVMPIEVSKKTELQLRKAGIRQGAAMRQFVLMRVLAVVSSFIIAIILYLVFKTGIAAFIGLILIFFSVLLPRIFLSQKVAQVQKEMFKGLPNLLDVLTISVEAGLGFDQALARAVQNLETPLGTFMRQILAEMSLGKTRREALKDASLRIEVDDIRSFLNALIQADRLGMGIAHVLRIQSQEARRKLRQRAEEQAMKAPIKILFPLIMFIFPGLFIVILGPAMLHIATVFTH